ncbi:MAG: hypothetical protein ABJN42_07435 [Roseibium sp.]|uniref:DUF5983 family protein n=1 Tax=Roseibium sp. TaxID=1936156 RepID=UPI00329A3FEC
MASQNKLGIENASIITISTAHLHLATREAIEREKGDLSEGPSVAVREEGFLVNSHLGCEDALEQDFSEGLYPALIDRMPDLVLIRALARGLNAAWINIDNDGDTYDDILPVYNDFGGIASTPTADGWREALSDEGMNIYGEMIMVSREVLEIIEAGQTPTTYSSPEM